MSEAEAEIQGSRCRNKDDEEPSAALQNHVEQGQNSEVLLNAGKDVDLQKPSIEAKNSEGESAESESRECSSMKDTPESPVLESGASMDVDELEHEIDFEHDSSNIPKRHRSTTISDICFAQVPRPSRNIDSTTQIDVAMHDPTHAEANSVDETNCNESDENSLSSFGEPTLKHASSKQKSKFKYSEGDHVYVEYRHILYSSTILKCRTKRSTSEYLVHYEGYKKSSNTWVKECVLHDVNVATTQRFEEQRLTQTDVLNQSEQSSDVKEVTNRRTA
jgi:hypothetical protein